MSAMLRCQTLLCLVVLSLGVLPSFTLAQTDYRDQRLRDQYQGKTFLLRGFYSDARLKYDAAGSPVGPATSGDWTIDGLVLVNDIHIGGQKIQIKARRVTAESPDKMLDLRLAETGKPGQNPKPLMVEIEADLGQHNPSLEQAEAALAKIFLTAQDDITTVVPDYWKPCLSGRPPGKPSCQFSPQLLAVPGFSHSDNSEAASNAGESTGPAPIQVLRAKSGITPPKAIFMPEPEFSERARQAKFQGIVVLGLVVTQEGLPTKIHIVTPLGSGLDEKAVQAVQRWTFKPAEKDGQPIPTEIMVEVNFHLY